MLQNKYFILLFTGINKHNSKDETDWTNQYVLKILLPLQVGNNHNTGHLQTTLKTENYVIRTSLVLSL